MKSLIALKSVLYTTIALELVLLCTSFTLAQTSNPDELFRLGCGKMYGDYDTQIDEREGLRLFQEAARAGSYDAQESLVSAYFDGHGTSVDYARAFRLACQLAESGRSLHSITTRVLALCYEKGLGGAEKNLELSQKYARLTFEGFKKGAEAGDRAQQNNLAQCYRNGFGVERNYVLAVKWFHKAAEQGYPVAQHGLAGCYKNGRGCKQDYKTAAYWFRKAAERGLSSAQCELGFCYDTGQGVVQDYKAAVSWYRKAAEQGDRLALCNLGVCYENGRGVVQDYKTAVNIYSKLAEQGYAEGQFRLGACYALGKGVSEDYKVALYWVRKAADQDHTNALRILAMFYRGGIVVAKDRTKAEELEERADAIDSKWKNSK